MRVPPVPLIWPLTLIARRCKSIPEFCGSSQSGRANRRAKANCRHASQLLAPFPETAMNSAILPLSRAARGVAFVASLVVTTALLAVNAGLVYSYSNASAPSMVAGAQCPSPQVHLSGTIVPRETAREHRV